MTTSSGPTATTPKRASKMSNLNMNHLLNFTLPPRQIQPLPRRSRKAGTHQVAWNKERECSHLRVRVSITIKHPSSGFVNAQYRFMMNPTGDYTVHFADPDMQVHISPDRAGYLQISRSFFQWHDVLQVIIPRSSALASAASNGERVGQQEGDTTCPICLSPPAAPRMTKCGHVSDIHCP
jgi:hypothetical protein